MTEKQQQLLFDKGITNVPSDALCSDNALEESLGMVYDNGEHRVIQRPKEYMTESNEIIYVHKFDMEEHFIVLNAGTLKWRTKDNSTLAFICNVDGTTQVTSIGKTLIINDTTDVKYFLWKQDKYEDLGVIPVPKPEYQMCKFEANAEPSIVKNPLDAPDYSMAEYWYTERKDVVKHTESFEGIFNTTKAMNSGPREPGDETEVWQEKHQKAYNDMVVSCYSANKKAVAEKNCFCNPFFVRIALELYDGTYYHIGAPMLMLPAVKSNSWVRLSGGFNYTMYTICRQLVVKQAEDYTIWSDIVKDVVLFVSDDIDVNETTMDIPIYKSHGTFEAKSFCSETEGYEWSLETIDETNAFDPDKTHKGEQGKLRYHFSPFKSREDADMNASIVSTSIFRKLCSLGIKSIGWTSTREKIEKHTLENINNQEQLLYDDYFSGSPLKSGYLYAYNGRLNLANVSRGFFDGYNFDAAYDVDIDIDGATKRISHTETVEDKTKAQCFYFFYPDPRAKKCGNHDLKEHPGLHGAYYFKGLQAIISEASSGAGRNSSSPSPVFSGNYESLPNYIITSEVNNPFTFKAEGYNRVGTDEVLAITSNTHALSEGQFGQHPLIVFSKNGIWAMELDSTGLFVSIRPVSREVCNNPKSITQTDSAVFFSSEKGLMVMSGSVLKCMSEQLSGKDLEPFSTFLRDAFIAYDYRDSLLWIFSGVSTECWVYAMKSGTFAHYNFEDVMITSVVNNYPDTLLQSSEKVYTLLERDNIKDDNEPYTATIITRPMKLENALALKSIMQIKHIHDMNTNASITFKMEGSNNLKNWAELKSLRGMPWKYYKFQYDFASLKATDRFAGTMLVTQERRTDKLR